LDSLFSIKNKHIWQVEQIYSNRIKLTISFKEFHHIFGKIPLSKIFLVCRLPPPSLFDQINTTKFLNKSFSESYLWQLVSEIVYALNILQSHGIPHKKLSIQSIFFNGLNFSILVPNIFDEQPYNSLGFFDKDPFKQDIC